MQPPSIQSLSVLLSPSVCPTQLPPEAPPRFPATWTPEPHTILDLHLSCSLKHLSPGRMSHWKMTRWGVCVWGGGHRESPFLSPFLSPPQAPCWLTLVMQHLHPIFLPLHIPHQPTPQGSACLKGPCSFSLQVFGHTGLSTVPYSLSG